uniref:Primase protein n=1 Tax=uncultured euryarchaeote Rifle_16ft_4_minimus_37664 TaxID=1665194 RepID=A0A0H4T4M4_9EURY|nr:primase protein [uncultured euryarchaeote Rifle_16ft_4_minimus_37664]
MEKYREMLVQISGRGTARLLDDGDTVSAEVPVRELVETLKTKKETRAVVFDGIITQRILDIAAEMNMHSVVGTKMGTITKQPAGIEVWTRSDFGP